MNNLDLLKKLCTANGISGDENSVREIIINEISDYVTEYKIDNLGNIIAFKKGRNKAVKRLMVSAHMDEVGFIVTDITSDGLIKFDTVGGIDRRVILGRSVLIGGKINGVTGVKPTHLCDADEGSKIPEINSMYIDIGTDTKEDAEKYISLGDSITFETMYEDNGYSIKSKAIDDRAGCFMLIQMIKSELEYDAYFTFVVQEEVGLHGAKVASYSVEPDFSIVLESTTAADIPEVSGSKQVCNVENGAVIGYMDKRTIYDKIMIKHAVSLAEKNNIKLQFKRSVAGGNDAGVIHESRGGVRTLAISLPCRYLHSQLSLIYKSDLDDTYNLACMLASDVAGGKL